jgi:hypothetical protein
MAHLALPNSELHVGVTFDDHPRVRALAAAPPGRTVVLFPTPDAIEPEALDDGTCDTLIVIDGTWSQARRMLTHNSALRALPHIGFVPESPGRYRIRREPAPHCRATIEAVVETLGRLEHAPTRFRPMLAAFDHMVEGQLHYKEARPNPYHRDPRRRPRPRPDPVQAELRARRDDLVVVYAEANAEARRGAVVAPPELVHLEALRPATGERLGMLIAPRRPLGARVPEHLDIDTAALLGGTTVADALTRWRAFLRADDLLCAWGGFTLTLLRNEGAPAFPALDLRAATTRRLGRRAGGVESAAALLAGGAPRPWSPGRAGVRIAALAHIVKRLSA